MGWNDHLPDPDLWEQHIDAMAFRADLERTRQREQEADAARLDRRSSVERADKVERALVDGPDGFDCGGIAA